MLSLLKKLFGGNSVDYTTLVANGAKMIDVRTPGEYSSGHAKGSTNIPLDTLDHKLASMKKNDVYILCCRSGMRSGSAVSKMKAKGFTNVYNAGPWTNLKGLKK